MPIYQTETIHWGSMERREQLSAAVNPIHQKKLSQLQEHWLKSSVYYHVLIIIQFFIYKKCTKLDTIIRILIHSPCVIYKQFSP